MPDFDLFADERATEGWPQWNARQEAELRKALIGLGDITEQDARRRILKLEGEHAHRRSGVWAELGMSPYVLVLEQLAIMAGFTSSSLAGGTEKDIADGYRSFGWKIDDALVSALKLCESADVFEAASVALRSLYYPWAEASALHLQRVWDFNAPDKKPRLVEATDPCILFVDGLRYDCAKRLSAILDQRGLRFWRSPDGLRFQVLPVRGNRLSRSCFKGRGCYG